MTRRTATFRGTAIATRLLALAFLLAVAATAALPAAAGAAQAKKKAAGPTTFCADPVDNYLAPLEKLQPIPAVPEGGALPFAARLTVGATGPQGLLVGGSDIGYRLTNTAPTAATARRLDWTVLERLIRFTKEGHDLHPEGLKRIDLRRLPGGKHRGLTFPIPSKPAVYSLEVTIQNHRGRRLGRYGEYVRVVEPTVSVGVTLVTYDDVVPGSYLESCFENHGSASVTPTNTRLERMDAGSWRPVAVGPQYSPAQTAIQRTLGPGETEKIGTLVPPNALPGLYKLTATGSVLTTGEPATTNAEFGVL